MPVGAYEPRWFMRPVHMNPEEAVRAFVDLGAAAAMVPMHWGTFKLTDEPMAEPPQRTAAAWRAAGLPSQALWVLSPGETRVVPAAPPD
jgi:L-ascorbate metabolism protein UlaG (beta-lactamase superfamily)